MTVVQQFPGASVRRAGGRANQRLQIDTPEVAPLSGVRLLRLIWIVMGVTVFTIFGWTAVAPLNKGMTASGALATESARQVIQHPDGGVLTAVLVNEGQPVRAGQVIATLDSDAAGADLELLRQAYFDRLGERAMLTAERGGGPILWPKLLADQAADPLVKTVMAAQVKVLADRRFARATKKDALARQVAGLRDEAAGYRAQMDSLKSQGEMIAEESKGVEALYKRGYAPKTRLLALQRSEASLRGDLGKTNSAISESYSRVGQVQMQILSVDADANEEVARRTAELDTEILSLAQKYARQKQIYDRSVVRSPVDGVVLDRQLTTIGGVLKPGDSLMEIVPVGDLVVTANIRPQDVDSVRTGMKATIKLPGLAAQTTPNLYGVVQSVSPDALSDAKSGVRFYSARVSVPAAERAKLHGALLTPGMPAEVLMDGGRRTALAYLLQPVSAAFGRAFRE